MRREIIACDLPFCKNETEPGKREDWLNPSVESGISFDCCPECSTRFTLADTRFRMGFLAGVSQLRIGLLKSQNSERTEAWYETESYNCAVELELAEGERALQLHIQPRDYLEPVRLLRAELDGVSLFSAPVLIRELQGAELPFPDGRQLRLEFSTATRQEARAVEGGLQGWMANWIGTPREED
ncbi:MAG: hypothetical protein K0U84_15155 [Actinomycetia bacterium]|nr:hypothetical protein [Actinomycetes bacterium]